MNIMQTPATPLTLEHLKQKLISSLRDLQDYLKNPAATMRNPPAWDWPQSLMLIGTMAAGAGVLTAIVERRPLGIILGLIFVPITAAVLTLITAGLLYYLFEFVFKKHVELLPLYRIAILAGLPCLALSIAAPLFPPLILLGMLVWAFLLYTAMVHHLGADANLTKKILIGVFALYALFWLHNSINWEKGRQALRDNATPESLDILEKELKDE